MVTFYALVAFGSNLFGAVATANYACGSEPLIFAMIASLFAMLLMYWERMGDNFCLKICAVFMVVLVLIVAAMLLTSMASAYGKTLRLVYIAYPDPLGSVGGFLVGLFLSFCMLPQVDQGQKRNTRERVLLIMGVVLTIFYFVALLAIFVGLSQPKNYWYIGA